MIYYFSATGNSKYVAERMAEALGEDCCSIEQVYGEVQFRDGEVVGLVAPTNWLGVALLARDFIKKTRFLTARGNYVFYVATYGLMPGAVGEDARRLFAGSGVAMDASYSVHMPENFTPIFSANCRGYNARLLEKCEGKIDSIIAQVKNRAKGNHTFFRLPYVMRSLMSVLLSYEQQTKRFRVDEEECVGCGRCAKRCPVQAITMTDGENGKHPVWTKEKCAICLGCLHRCPKNAINYGASKGHGQYLNPKTAI